MPTFREDLHLGHEVATVDHDDLTPGCVTEDILGEGSVSTDKLQDRSVTEPKLADDAVSTRTIQNNAVTEPKLADHSVSHRTLQDDAVHGDNIIGNAIKSGHISADAVTTPKIKDKAVTPEKVSDNFGGSVVLPLVTPVDQKYANITDELYSMIASLQVGGIALSNQFGNREDIGITQKALTRMFGALWGTIESLHPGHAVFDFTLTVNPQYIFNEIVEDHVSVKADCTGAVSDFDSVKVYVDDELKAESKGIRVYETSVIVTKTSTIKVVGTILGREIVKTAQVINEIPFFMGGGMEYTDIMNEECRKELVGSLEGGYDSTISTTGQYLFIIIPISRKEEFRRCKMDMNGFEIPIETTEMTDYIVCKSLNQYQAGTYNIDIDINS